MAQSPSQSVWSGFRGQEQQREMFRRAAARGRLSQSYLFVGPDGVGKQLFATHVAQSLICQQPGREPLEACGVCASCRPFLAGTHPDFLRVARVEGKREFTIDLVAGSKERRGHEGLCHDLSLKPLEGSRKVAILVDADTMNSEAANAFLKTLEEPPERAMLMLTASNIDAVLPTIRSRCQLVRFSPLAPDDVAALLLEHGLADSTDDAREAARLSEGSLTLAHQLLRPELRQLRETLYAELSQHPLEGLKLAGTMTKSIESMTSDTPEQRECAHWVFKFVVAFYRAALRELIPTDPATAPPAIPQAARWVSQWFTRRPPADLVSVLLERTFDAAEHVEQNVPVPLVLETLFHDLASALREPALATR